MYSKKQIEETLNRICQDIQQGCSLRDALSKDNTPSNETFYKWLESDKDNSKQYARACEDRATSIFEDILEIADNQSRDTITLEDGKEVFNNEFAARSRIKIDARKWMLGKMQPKKYSDKIQVDTTQFEEQPLFPDVSKDNSDK